MEDKLSVVITTYNRKNTLIELLRTLFNQHDSRLAKIVISDNNSNYDIENVLNSEFSIVEMSKVIIHRNKINVGACANIANSFSLCNTKWMWLMSDDDLPVDGCFDIIYKYIEMYPDMGAFKFSTMTDWSTMLEDDIIIDSLSNLISYYKNKMSNKGNLYFMSNNVFNIENLASYTSEANVYSYTQVPHLIPILFGLDNKSIKLKLCSDILVHFKVARDGKTWNLLKGQMGMSTLLDIPFRVDFNTTKDLGCLFSIFNFGGLLNLLYESDINNKKFYLKRIVNNNLIYTMNVTQKIMYLISLILFDVNLFEPVYRRIKGFR